MRTTIEMKPEHRARLMEISAQRGEKGFSGVVEEALEQYFQASSDRQRAIAKALDAEGFLKEPEANELRDRAQKIRDSWR